MESTATIVARPAVIQTEFAPNLAQRLKRNRFQVHFGQESARGPAVAVVDIGADGLVP